MKTSYQITITLSLCLTMMVLLCAKISAQAPDALTAPELEKAVPASLDMAEDFKPPEGGKRESIGFRRTAGVALKEQQGIHPICIVEARKGIIANDPFEVNDVIIAVNGKALGKNPALQFRQVLDQAKKSSGVLWVTRWRKGIITRCKSLG